jgi:hypothetical protein
MIISSRTPEGSPNQCPICQSEVRIEPSKLCGDAPCPNCGCLLWFVTLTGENQMFFEYEAAERIRDRLLGYLTTELGMSRETLESKSLDELGVDSLEIAELVMELENEYETRK